MRNQRKGTSWGKGEGTMENKEQKVEEIKKKMHSEQIYDPGDADLTDEQFGYVNRLYDFNMTRPGVLF